MKVSISRRTADCKRRIERRLERKNILVVRERPVFSGDGIDYQVAGRSRGIAAGRAGGDAVAGAKRRPGREH